MSRTLIVGDLHGCADEFGRLLQRASPTRVILVGDLFTRGPDPAGVWKLIKRTRAEAVLGNHDAAVLDEWKPGRQLPKKAFKWLEKRPLTIHGKGWMVVHAGVHPRRGPAHVRRDHALFMRDWRGKPWWRQYQGDDLIVHGHDARHGLVDRRPHTLGLDTGCARGGRLTGYILERDEVVSIRARRIHAD